MKKIYFLFLFLFTLTATISCTNNEDNDSLEVITPVDEEESKKAS